MKKLLQILILSLSCLTSGFADSVGSATFPHPLYFGVLAGYGSTTWDGLVPKGDHQNSAMAISTPSNVTEGGVTGGFFLGYELIPFFALEGSYQRFPDATLHFDPLSLFSFFNDGVTELKTKTETVSLMGKVMLLIPNTKVRAFSSFGAAGIHRDDNINDRWILSPTFAVGLSYIFADHWMAEIGGNYTTGNGEAELNPADDYIPFLYSLFVRLAYRI